MGRVAMTPDRSDGLVGQIEWSKALYRRCGRLCAGVTLGSFAGSWHLREEHTLRNSGFSGTLHAEVDLSAERKREQCKRTPESLLRGYPVNAQYARSVR